MGVIATVAVVLVAWCVCALVVGVVVGRAIALRPGPGVTVPEPRGARTATATIASPRQPG